MGRIEIWEVVNGLMAVLGVYFLFWVVVYLRHVGALRSVPWQILTYSFAFIILGHTIKDGTAWWSRVVLNAQPPADLPLEIVALAVGLIVLGKLGCIYFWTRSRGAWPWLLALVIAGVFLFVNWLL